MRKKIMYFLWVLLVVSVLSACGKKDVMDVSTEKNQESQNEHIESSDMDTTDVEKIDYQKYSGYWSVNGDSHDEIIENGGTELYCSITESNVFEGWIFEQQGMTERIVEIDNISAEIKNNEVFFDFTDDGWGNSGTLHITFSEGKIDIEVIDFIMDEENLSGYGFSGNYTFIKMNEDETQSNVTETETDEIIEEINAKSQYYQASKYYEKVINYWEVDREVTDIANLTDPLFNTDTVIYTENDLENEPDFIIHLGKNEIYARHGYIFKDEDLNNYFMGCIWYNPTTTTEQFDDSVFNEIEKENLELFSKMDTLK